MRPACRNDICASFATAFKSWRRTHSITLKQVAGDLGLSIATINKWERGERFPTGRHLELLAEYTHQPPCRLVCRLADKCILANCPLLTRQRL